jgi:outer membrane immunogenic protein
MKKIFLFLLFASASITMHAQYKLNKGDAQLNAGLGLSTWGIPVYVGFDYGVHKDISIGGELSFRSYTDEWHDHDHGRDHDYRYHHTIFGISANGNYHLNTILKIPTQWDLYAGINVGFYAWSYPDDYHGNRVSGLGLGAQVGGRYYFNDNVAINLELGGGNAFGGGKIGISYKF